MKATILALATLLGCHHVGVAHAQWTLRREVDPMTDRVAVWISRPAVRAIAAWPRKSLRPELVVQCRRGKVSVILVIGTALQPYSVDSAAVAMRLDAADVVTLPWSQSTTSEAYFGPEPLELLRMLESAKRARFEVVPFNSAPQVAEFDLAGLTKAATPVRTACQDASQ